MKKALIIIIIIVVAFFVLNRFGLLRDFNDPINQLVSGEPDFSCQTVEDCKLYAVDCGSCRCAQAVNKDWGKFCPFESVGFLTDYYCETCPPVSEDDIRCIDNKCQI